MSKWTSNAAWPLDVYRGMRGDGITTDDHETRESAQAVCDALRKDGFGGQRLNFPLRTWVAEAQS
jgi:hypothetical protein